MSCKFCDRFWDWYWENSDAWERAHANESELWSEESDQNRELIQQASAIAKTDPAAAFRLYLEAAEAGSVLSIESVGWHYWSGTGVAADLGKAQEYYYRAVCAGSWMATLGYARLLAEVGRKDDCEIMLKDGVASGFVPAYFWLAWLRYERSKTRKVCEEVRPLMEYAAKQGHPGAKLKLEQWMIFGKFGLREIFGGIRLALQSAIQLARETPEDAEFQGTAAQMRGRK